MTTTTLIKTPITYYGGNQAIISSILPLIPAHEVYTESFFGGGTVFFAKDPAKNETINDRLDIVINFYKVLKTKFRDLKKLIDISLISRTTYKQANMICLNQVPADEVTKAWAFWYCTNFSFSNKIGAGIKYSNEQTTVVTRVLKNKKESFTELLVNRIENAIIENNDATTVLNSRNVPQAFHYIDSPYYQADHGHYKGFTDNDLLKLLTWCADECKGKFLMANYTSPILEKLIKVHGWNSLEITHKLAAPRKLGPTKNVWLVWNYELPVKRDLFNH